MLFYNNFNWIACFLLNEILGSSLLLFSDEGENYISFKSSGGLFKKSIMLGNFEASAFNLSSLLIGVETLSFQNLFGLVGRFGL